MNAQALSQNDTAPIPVIFRKDAANNKVAFIQSSLNLAVPGGEIEVWHPGSGRNTKKVDLAYYHNTSKLADVEEIELANTFAGDYVPKFGIQIRKRLGKELALHHSHPARSANNTLRRASDKAPTQEATLDEKLEPLENLAKQYKGQFDMAKFEAALTVALPMLVRTIVYELSQKGHKE